MKFWLACGVLGLVSLAQAQNVKEWLTLPDRSALLAEQPVIAMHAPGSSDEGVIVVDRSQHFQTMDGFGFALTGGTAQLMMEMSAEKRAALLRELFAPQVTAEGQGIGVSYLRVSIGSSDMNSHAFTYDDLPEGETDPKLKHFSLGEDGASVIPVLREILKINPGIEILGSPWSAPAWMKTNGKLKAGSLKPELYGVYAQYFVRYLKTMRSHGIVVSAITIQNEPLNPKNTPSMVMQPVEEEAFLRDWLGPALHQASLRTKVILYDHNCDRPDYPETILNDPAAAQYADGSGFHLYAGDATAMSETHARFPDKNVYFTEQMVVDRKDAVDLRIASPEARIVIAATRNWSRNVLLWNLGADAEFGPHTSDGGCPMCEGAVTIEGDAVTRNLAYWTLAQVSKFVPPGSVRVESNEPPGLRDVAFLTPSGKTVLVVANPSDAVDKVSVRNGMRQFDADLAPGAAATFVW